MTEITVDGHPYWYEQRGAGAPVVLLHGLSLDSAMWEPCAALLATRHRCVSVDLLGHGRSSAPPASYDLDSEAVRIHALLSAIDALPAHLVGFSMGAMLCLRIALIAPEAVTSLVLISASADRAHAPQGMGPGVSHAEIVFSNAFRRRDADAVERYLGRAFDPATSRVAQQAVARRRSILPELGAIQAPALVIAGELDVAIDPGQSKRIVEGLPAAELVLVPGSGHMVLMEEPDIVSAAIASFLGGVT